MQLRSFARVKVALKTFLARGKFVTHCDNNVAKDVTKVDADEEEMGGNAGIIQKHHKAFA